MAVVTMKQLLDSGVHFGHQTRRWNPKMKRYILTERNGIYIIDLQQTLSYIDRAYEFVKETVAHGGSILFIGTKKQAQEAIADEAGRVNMPYVNQRWLGGMLTNFQTVHKRLQRLKELEAMEQTGGFEGRTKKEILMLTREKTKLEKTLGGIRDMAKVPSAVWIVDTKKEHIAVGEARKLGIPVVSILDTNCDPDEVDYPIPGNDDAIRSAALLTKVIARAAADGLMARSQRARGEGAESRCRRGRAARRVGAGAAHQRYRLGRREPARPRRGGDRRGRSVAPAAASSNGTQQTRAETDAGAGPDPARHPWTSPERRAPSDAYGHTPDKDVRDPTMANYTAADVKRLRELTGSGMMDCKKALEQSDGDLEKAVELLRIKGAKDVGKRAERATSNGLVVAADGVMVELTARPTSSPRAPTSRPWPTRSCRSRWTRSPPTWRRCAPPSWATAPSRTPCRPCRRASARSSSSSATSRSTARWRSTCTAARRTCRPRSACWSPTTAAGNDQAADTARGVAMHVAAARPRYTTRDQVPADVLDNERRIAEATAREEGKPEQVLARIVEGRVNGYFKDVVLLEQPSVQDPKKTVKALLDEAGLTVKDFARFEVGQA